MMTKVDAFPEVKGIITQNTVEGREAAKAIPSDTVSSAGTPAAAAIAGK